MIRPRTYKNLHLEKIHLGVTLTEAVESEADSRDAKRIVVVTSKTFARTTSHIDDVADALGSRCVGRFDQTVEHVPRAAVFHLARYLRERDADLVLTIGGGTPIDTVKMALLCLAEGLEEPDELDRFAISVREDGSRHSPEIRCPPLRQIVAPTTLSGAEFSDLAGCTDLQSQTKHLFSGADLGAVTVILDPSITVHTPKDLWLSTGVRAIDHAIEALCSTVPEPVADAGALQALRLLSQSLPRNARAEGELDARLDSQIGVWLACAGLNRVPYGASHGIGHQLGAVAGVPHGFTSCVMLPHVLAYNESSTESTQRLIAEALGKPGQSASAAVADLIEGLGMPTRLRDVGVKRNHFSAIASGSLLNPWVRANPRRIDSDAQILEILEQAY